MDVIYLISIIHKKIKFLLVFFCVALLLNCSENKVLEGVHVNYENGKAINVQFKARESADFRVFLKQNDLAPILGSIEQDDDVYTFTPIVAFSQNETYEIRENGKLLGSFTIDPTNRGLHPELIAIYPSLDTVPQNLLKM